MSPQAIESRLRLTSDLRRLCLDLAEGKKIEREEIRQSAAEPTHNTKSTSESES